MKLKNIVIIILIALLIVLSFTFFIRENLHALELKKLNKTFLQKERAWEITLTDFIVNYDRLYKDYQSFLEKYRKQSTLLTELEVQNEIASSTSNKNFIIRAWEKYEVTGYSPLECGTVTSIGIDLKQSWTKLFNIAAVDPKIIPYGSILLIDFGDEVKIYLAADCGALIKGHKIDLFFNDAGQAIEFGVQILKVKVIN